jgi:hypothetical protein
MTKIKYWLNNYLIIYNYKLNFYKKNYKLVNNNLGEYKYPYFINNNIIVDYLIKNNTFFEINFYDFNKNTNDIAVNYLINNAPDKITWLFYENSNNIAVNYLINNAPNKINNVIICIHFFQNNIIKKFFFNNIFDFFDSINNYDYFP